MFDVSKESVEEVLVQPHAELEAAEEILLQQQQHQLGDGLSQSVNSFPALRATPIPLVWEADTKSNPKSCALSAHSTTSVKRPPATPDAVGEIYRLPQGRRTRL